jgi:hypothetical protein
MALERGWALGSGQVSVKKHNRPDSFLTGNRALLATDRPPTIVDATAAAPTDTKKVRLDNSTFIINT